MTQKRTQAEWAAFKALVASKKANVVAGAPAENRTLFTQALAEGKAVMFTYYSVSDTGEDTWTVRFVRPLTFTTQGHEIVCYLLAPSGSGNKGDIRHFIVDLCAAPKLLTKIPLAEPVGVKIAVAVDEAWRNYYLKGGFQTSFKGTDPEVSEWAALDGWALIPIS